jgi:hypothetical protein
MRQAASAAISAAHAEKEQIVAATMEPGAVASDIAVSRSGKGNKAQETLGTTRVTSTT